MPSSSRLRIIQMVSSIGMEASGPSYSVPRMCQALSARGHEVALHVLKWTPVTPSVAGVDVVVHPFFDLPLARKLGVSPSMWKALRSDARTADIVHTNGMWMFTNLYSAWAATRARVRLVTSPRGTLAPAARKFSPHAKRMMWALAQRSAANSSDLFHATSDQERADIREAGMVAPVAVIPNGVDLPSETHVLDRSARKRRLLFLGRVHPVKGLDFLLRAWATLERRHTDWSLHIVGPSEGSHREDMARLAAELGLARVHFDGPKYGSEKNDAYARADLFVLPTTTENFGMSIAESLAAGVPVVVTRGAPWSGVHDARCGMWIERSVESLTTSLDTMMSMPPDERFEMGLRGREWMARDFSWEAVAGKLELAYEAALGRTPTPPFVTD